MGLEKMKYTNIRSVKFAAAVAMGLAFIGTACGQNTGDNSTACTPVDMGAANSPEQKPAFAGQTRVCAIRSLSLIHI